MYLETWMIALLVLSFGVCAYYSRRTGFILGATVTIQALERERLIKHQDDVFRMIQALSLNLMQDLMQKKQ